MSNSLYPDQDHTIGPDLGNWVQAVLEGNQQKTKVTARKERVNFF